MSITPVPTRAEIKIGQTVWAIEKKNYGSGVLTEGKVARILTSSPIHPRGIKVMFDNGIVARVQSLIPPDAKIQTEQSITAVNSADEYSLR